MNWCEVGPPTMEPDALIEVLSASLPVIFTLPVLPTVIVTLLGSGMMLVSEERSCTTYLPASGRLFFAT